MQEDDLVLAVNSGSSSLKFALFTEQNGEETTVFKGEVDAIGSPEGRLHIRDAHGALLVDEPCALDTQPAALAAVLAKLSKFGARTPVAVGHRIVHGGPHLREHQKITAEVIRTLEKSLHFAPLHIPSALTLIRKIERLLPDAQQFACFDTAFHSTMPETSYRFALPEELYRRGVQRYGFHGLSYESVLHRLGDSLPARAVCAHLGSGASLVALLNGRSIDTSMGLTPTGGVPMATRCGDLDPGVLLFLMRSERMTADTLEKILNHHAGLGALSGGQTDMRLLQSSMEQGDLRATLAVRVFASAVRKAIGAFAAELGGLDLLIFTGGIGEHSPWMRGLICQGLEFLGVGDQATSGGRIVVLPSDEEIQIARHARRLMWGSAHSPYTSCRPVSIPGVI
jgi:acetate kinase